MSLETALATYLAAQLEADVNPSISRRKERPYLIYQLISGGDHVRHTLAGSGFAEQRVQFSLFGDTIQQVAELGEDLRETLDNFRGQMNGLEVQGIFLDTPFDLYVNPEDASQTGKHHRIITASIWYEESITAPSSA